MKRWRPTYSLLDVMRANPELPMPAERSRHQLTRMHEGLLAIETAPNPKPDDWRVVADAVPRYTDAMLRHWLKESRGTTYDESSELHHAAHVAWNALARLQLIIERDELPF